MATPERLQKFMARCGIASRREAENIILAGRVKVNKKIVTELGTKVDTDNDKVFLDGELIRPEKKLYYIMLNKPKGYVTTAKDEFDRKTVMELVADVDARLYPVGRLDYDSEGLLLLTNDGDFAYRMTHPTQHIPKKYHAIVSGTPDVGHVMKLRCGVEIDGYVTKPARVDIAETRENTTQLNITISEGKNRQIRKMCEAIGFPVIKLKRVSIGNVHLGNLPKGKWRHLSEGELNILNGKR
ncbi:MAG: rRNA pseudouridine synthase [Clostridia bacterium]|nr:rRNA pseudouridine synthase [Clostridia bacterium]